jgi:diketogulonate reductase-like aldo/keto reductase
VWRRPQRALTRCTLYLFVPLQTRAIGVSNFKQLNLAALMKTAKVTPAINQISFSVGNVDSTTISASRSLGIAIEAYSPLGHTGAPVMKNPVRYRRQRE